MVHFNSDKRHNQTKGRIFVIEVCQSTPYAPDNESTYVFISSEEALTWLLVIKNAYLLHELRWFFWCKDDLKKAEVWPIVEILLVGGKLSLL